MINKKYNQIPILMENVLFNIGDEYTINKKVYTIFGMFIDCGVKQYLMNVKDLPDQPQILINENQLKRHENL